MLVSDPLKQIRQSTRLIVWPPNARERPHTTKLQFYFPQSLCLAASPSGPGNREPFNLSSLWSFLPTFALNNICKLKSTKSWISEIEGFSHGPTIHMIYHEKYTNALEVLELSCEITNSIFIIYNSLSISIIGKHLLRYDMIFRIGTSTAGNKV